MSPSLLVLRKMDLNDIKDVDRISDFVLASQKIKPGNPSMKQEDFCRYLNSSLSFILQTSNQGNISN